MLTIKGRSGFCSVWCNPKNSYRLPC